MADPIKTCQSDRLHLLSTLFPPTLPFSSDLQQLILDFVFYRRICEKTYKDEKCWVRLSIAVKDDKYYYENVIYNNKIFIVQSTYSIRKSLLALFNFNLIANYKDDISDGNFCWCRIYEALVVYSRYVFCPKDNNTYRLEVGFKKSAKEKMHIRIMQVPNALFADSYSDKNLNKFVVGSSTGFDFNTEKSRNLENMIRQYEIDWSKYPASDIQKTVWDDFEDLKYHFPADDVFEIS